jgi:hypothetical protein
MKKNVGKIDMIIRIIIGIVIASLGIVYQSWWGLVAILPLLTAFINFCPLYSVLGMSTCSVKEQKTL